MSIKVDHVDLVIYHDRCPDGTAAAWPFWRERHADFVGGKIRFEGWMYGRPPPSEIKGLNVVIVDFSFPRRELIAMASTAKSIVVLDHHATAQRDLEGDLPANVSKIFDMDRSGAQIAWDYVYPNTPRPWFIDLIGDRDLYRFHIPYTKSVGTAMMMKGYNTWENLENLYMGLSSQAETIAELSKLGNIYLEQIERELSTICSRAILADLTTPKGTRYRVKIVDCPAQHRSDVGNRLASSDLTVDFAVMWRYDLATDVWSISCRASSTSSVDLSEVCSHFKNGGGHRRAAGFAILGSSGESLRSYFRPVVETYHVMT
jgi:oligoribonuclease NrnB/cAMP/cGMP phosphodiesterase (DHH superfamily)